MKNYSLLLSDSTAKQTCNLVNFSMTFGDLEDPDKENEQRNSKIDKKSSKNSRLLSFLKNGKVQNRRKVTWKKAFEEKIRHSFTSSFNPSSSANHRRSRKGVLKSRENTFLLKENYALNNQSTKLKSSCMFQRSDIYNLLFKQIKKS